jgi:hypothetical protein
MRQPLIKYPFPLGDGTIVFLFLPEILTIEDVIRMEKYLISLCAEELCAT